MHTTQQLCRAVMRKEKITSAYALAKVMGVTSSSAERWLSKRSRLSTDNAVKCAQLLSLPEAYVVACVNYEKEKSDTAREFWKSLAENLPNENAA